MRRVSRQGYGERQGEGLNEERNRQGEGMNEEGE